MAAPLCAALIAIAKGIRRANGLPDIGFLHPTLYQQRATAFIDVVKGSNGYQTLAGYDIPTGLGVPNGAAFMSAIAGTTTVPPPPVGPPIVPPPPIVLPPPPPIPVPVCVPPPSAPSIASQINAYVRQYGKAILPWLEVQVQRDRQLTHKQKLDLLAYCNCLQRH